MMSGWMFWLLMSAIELPAPRPPRSRSGLPRSALIDATAAGAGADAAGAGADAAGAGADAAGAGADAAGAGADAAGGGGGGGADPVPAAGGGDGVGSVALEDEPPPQDATLAISRAIDSRRALDAAFFANCIGFLVSVLCQCSPPLVTQHCCAAKKCQAGLVCVAVRSSFCARISINTDHASHGPRICNALFLRRAEVTRSRAGPRAGEFDVEPAAADGLQLAHLSYCLKKVTSSTLSQAVPAPSLVQNPISAWPLLTLMLLISSCV